MPWIRTVLYVVASWWHDALRCCSSIVVGDVVVYLGDVSSSHSPPRAVSKPFLGSETSFWGEYPHKNSLGGPKIVERGDSFPPPTTGPTTNRPKSEGAVDLVAKLCEGLLLCSTVRDSYGATSKARRASKCGFVLHGTIVVHVRGLYAIPMCPLDVFRGRCRRAWNQVSKMEACLSRQ